MNSHRHRPNAGFSLIELLVATAIGLLTVLAIMQSLSSFTGLRRGATGSTDMQVNSALALYAVERDLRMAGYGLATADTGGTNINPEGLLNICGAGTTYAYSANRATTPAFTYSTAGVPLVPFTIYPSTATTIPPSELGQDALSVNYGGSAGFVTDRTRITLDLVPPVATLENRAGLHTGELAVLIGPPGSNYCDLIEITKMPSAWACDAAGSTTEISFSSANAAYNNYWSASPPGSNCVGTPPLFNNPGGVHSMAYNTGHIVALGKRESFVSKVYAVRNGSLRVCNMLTHDCTRALSGMTAAQLLDYWKPIAPGIIAFHVEYTTSVSPGTWAQAAPTNWTQVTAARVVMVARSEQRERDAIDYTTTTVPNNLGKIFYGSGASEYIDITPSNNALAPADDWKHYRYKIVQSKFVLPNLVGAKQLTPPPN